MKATLINVNVNKPGSNGEMTFTVTYEYESDGEVIECEMEVESPFTKNYLHLWEDKITYQNVESILACDNARILKQKCRTLCKAEPTELTFEEIEKRLGYPIKIVKGDK